MYQYVLIEGLSGYYSLVKMRLPKVENTLLFHNL